MFERLDWLYIILRSAREYFIYTHKNITIPGEGLPKGQAYTWRLRFLSTEDVFYNDTVPRFAWSYSKGCPLKSPLTSIQRYWGSILNIRFLTGALLFCVNIETQLTNVSFHCTIMIILVYIYFTRTTVVPINRSGFLSYIAVCDHHTNTFFNDVFRKIM